ncbi:protein GPR108 [Brachionichthys hirsutus]|uniref:protein GPR108 n=1 Tax=Brachionichthys hirsutus TaxID=412623 RepID=UPI003604C629
MAAEHRACVGAGYLLLLLLAGSQARIHKLTLKNETRLAVDLSSFGFFANGTLDVNLRSLLFSGRPKNSSSPRVGFSFSRSRVNGILSYTAEDSELCPLAPTQLASKDPVVLFLIDINSLSVNVKALGKQDNVLIAKQKAEPPKGQRKARDAPVSEDEHRPADGEDKSHEKSGNDLPKDSKDGVADDQKEAKGTDAKAPPVGGAKRGMADEFQLGAGSQRTLALDEANNSYNFSFRLVVGPEAEGLYTLKFHYCPNKSTGKRPPYSFTVDVTEMNPGSYLSAAEIPLSRLYIGMAGVFFTAAMVWVYILMKHRYSVFKIHWLMAALAFTKSTSLVFHSINYHFINIEGHPIEGWAVMYYITHLLKGALLFITLALIGTGWAFVKYILSDKEKKIFMIVIPLQVLANVAYIIIESTEEGYREYNQWKQVLFLVDLICCGAVLFPVVWSIRHLQEASTTDGKAAMNLEKLKLFRHYYVMIVCYIYFTRIIAILLEVTMPFQWQWCYQFLVEVSTLVFFVLTGYKFRPASNNPYLQLPQDEEEMDEVVTESGALEGISQVKKTCNGRDRQKESTL